ncbi:hypothetical protein H6F89_32870 [Cyanobacteria bacterium FACHB-63]|nr:hypothetical protein [Cyanobacteria bacterium FACHB-63]
MLSYQSLRNKPRIFQSLTGMSPSEFEKLLPSFEQAWQAYVVKHHIEEKSRQRRYGGGRAGQLKADCDKLLFILV